MATPMSPPTRPASAPHDALATAAAPYDLRGRELLRFLIDARRNPLIPLCAVPGAPGPVRIHTPSAKVFIVRDPFQARHILLTNQDAYAKGIDYRILGVLLGQGLLTNSDPVSWQRQRKLVQPMFAKRHLAPMAGHMTAAATDWLDRWEARAVGPAQPLDVAEAMNALTLDVVDRALFGVTVDEETTQVVGRAMSDVLHAGTAYLRQGAITRPATQAGLELRTVLRVRSRQWRKVTRGIAALDDVVGGMIDAHERDPHADRENLLALLLAARDEETGAAMSRDQVRDEVMTFLAAGHETTANALAWTWMLLSRHPQVRERLHAEVDDVLGGRVPTAQDADALPYVSAVLQEAMRLYPPVPAISREALQDDDIGGMRVPAGSVVLVMPYLMHRDARLWPNPEGFDPRRFLPGAPGAADRPRQAFMPFGAGRRICVGSGFALMEGILLIAMIAQRFELDLVSGAQVEAEVAVTLRPREALPMTLRLRAPGAA